MKEVIKSAEFIQIAESVQSLDAYIKTLRDQRRVLVSKGAETFTKWRMGQIVKLNQSEFMILDLTLYADHYLKESVYDKQFVVTAMLVESKKDSLALPDRMRYVILSPNGDVYDYMEGGKVAGANHLKVAK